WRCKDCSLGSMHCRQCIRKAHQENPFHKIERWTGQHFRPAELWEVGTYLLEDITAVPQYIGPEGPSQTEQVAGEQQNSEGRESLPRRDMFYNQYVRIVHTNGLHNLAMVHCMCQGPTQLPLDLFANRLIPSSFEKIRTIFTAQVLDHFRLCNLELKASAYQFHSLLRRMTAPMAPAKVLNLYNVFRRMTRLWRWMKKLKWAGYGCNGRPVKDLAAGELANFCVACPITQGMDKNVADNWKDDPNRWVYRRQFVADGNFKADHVKAKVPSADVWLLDGAGMDPRRAEYWAFLKTALERFTAPCENTFRAIMNALLASKVCDVTGKVAVACARHGCYSPGALVDLYHGEQQKNVDFALLQAIKNVDPDQGVMLIYDIACQYFVHLHERIGHLLPEGLDIDRAIGLFHVHAHKEDCFFRFATSFIPGCAITAGEILESLWAELNLISPAARTATLPHRSEIVDDHACDSNHKKCLGMTAHLCKKLTEAVKTYQERQADYEKQSNAVDSATLQTWNDAIIEAERLRKEKPEVMDIYKAAVQSAGSRATVENPQGARTPVEAYFDFCIVVERTQNRIFKKEPREPARQKIEALRLSLQGMLQELARLQDVAGIQHNYVNGDTSEYDQLDENGWNDWEDIANESGQEDNDENQPSGPGADTIPTIEDSCYAENRKLVLPSNKNTDMTYASVELAIREEQAIKELSHLRDLIAEKSFQFSGIYRAGRKHMKTRAREVVREMNHRIGLHCAAYNKSRRRMLNLGADPKLMQDKFQPLKKDDVKTSTAVLNPNMPGSTKLQLSWIWKTHNYVNGDTSEYDQLDENVKRVHWLRARAQADRWREECQLLTYEMQWTVRSFVQKSKLWLVLKNAHNGSAPSPGTRAYADRQSRTWHAMAVLSDRDFRTINKNYISPL
ncbi:hypothetical protein CPC08DRAFT_647294, partial [Agrocybe pediades]